MSILCKEHAAHALAAISAAAISNLNAICLVLVHEAFHDEGVSTYVDSYACGAIRVMRVYINTDKDSDIEFYADEPSFSAAYL